MNFWHKSIALNCFAQGDCESTHRFFESRTLYCESRENVLWENIAKLIYPD